MLRIFCIREISRDEKSIPKTLIIRALIRIFFLIAFVRLAANLISDEKDTFLDCAPGRFF